MPSMHSRAVSAPPLEPVAPDGEQAWPGTCSLPRSSDDDAEGTRSIPPAPGLGHPSSPVPVSLYFLKESVIVKYNPSPLSFPQARPEADLACLLSRRRLSHRSPRITVGLACVHSSPGDCQFVVSPPSSPRPVRAVVTCKGRRRRKGRALARGQEARRYPPTTQWGS